MGKLKQMKIDSKMSRWATKSPASAPDKADKGQRRGSLPSGFTDNMSKGGQNDTLEERRSPPAADSRSSERLEKKSETGQVGVRLRSQSFIEDARVRPKMTARISPTDQTGHPLASVFEPVREWNEYNEKQAVSLIQRHFNRKKDPTWPDLMNGNQASKVMRAKNVINRIMSRATKISYGPDRRGVMVARYTTHGDEQVDLGPGKKNTGQGVMYNAKGMTHLIDRDRSEEVLAADQQKHAAEMMMHRGKKEQAKTLDAPGEGKEAT